MLKESITYTDFNGLERTEEFYFNLTKTELIRMETSKNGSLSNMLTRIVNAKDLPDIIETIEMLIRKAYGEKSEDGKRFNKSEEISNDFACTAAYDVLFDKLTNDSDYAYKFVIGLMPAEMQKQIAENGNIVELPKA